MFKIDGVFRTKQFLNVLTLKVKHVLNLKWSIEEKKIIENTFKRFNKISKLNIYDNSFNHDNKTDFHKRNEANSNKRYPYNNIKNQSWRKQKVDSSDNRTNNSQKYQSASKYFNHNKSVENHRHLDINLSTNQHKVIDDNFQLPIKKCDDPINEVNLNDSNIIQSKLKKFENKFSSSRDLNIILSENKSINTPSSSRMRGRGICRYNGNKPSWRNQQDDYQNQDNPIFNNLQRSQGYNNAHFPKNQRGGNPRYRFQSGGSHRKDIDDTES